MLDGKGLAKMGERYVARISCQSGFYREKGWTRRDDCLEHWSALAAGVAGVSAGVSWDIRLFVMSGVLLCMTSEYACPARSSIVCSRSNQSSILSTLMC
jgi:hypothetical protein